MSSFLEPELPRAGVWKWQAQWVAGPKRIGVLGTWRGFGEVGQNGGLCIRKRGLHRKTLDGFNPGSDGTWFLLRSLSYMWYTHIIVWGRKILSLCRETLCQKNLQNGEGRKVEERGWSGEANCYLDSSVAEWVGLWHREDSGLVCPCPSCLSHFCSNCCQGLSHLLQPRSMETLKFIQTKFSMTSVGLKQEPGGRCHFEGRNSDLPLLTLAHVAGLWPAPPVLHSQVYPLAFCWLMSTTSGQVTY